MKNILKRISIIVLIIGMCYIFWGIMSDSVQATDDYRTDMQGFINKSWESDTTAKTSVTSATNIIISSIKIAGVAIAIIMLLVIAMKYMTAAPGEKADIKKSAIQYVVGAVVLFGVTGILTIIEQFADGI